MPVMSWPALEEFLIAPVEQIRLVAPETAIFAPGGTRRQAVLNGVSPESEEFKYLREPMLDCIAHFFRLGVQHLFVTALGSAQLRETGRYRERVLEWITYGLASPETLADCERRGWRTRIVGAEQIPALLPIAEQLLAATPRQWTHTIWWYVSPEPGAHWKSLLSIAQRTQAQSQTELIRAFCGADVPPASLLVSYGKRVVAA